ncbi:MAG: hypothetical protein ACI4EJ_10085 [Bacteroides sp.]
MEKEYKKSYKGFVGLMILFVALMFLLPFIPNADAKVITIILLNFMNLWMALLTWVIYKTQKIYWYTGLTYEEAKKADPDSRKRYAMRHFKRFAGLAAVFALYSVISYFFKVPLAADILLGTIGLVAVAISTINIKLA